MISYQQEKTQHQNTLKYSQRNRRQKDWQMDGHRDRKTDRQTGRATETDREINSEKDTQSERQKDKIGDGWEESMDVFHSLIV